jgi:YfiH family protein
MLLQFSHLQGFSSLKHFVSTRNGGVSKAPFDACNMSYAVADNPAEVAQNREIVCQKMGFVTQQLCVPQQTHSATIQVVTEVDKGKGAYDFVSGIPNTDGLVSNQKNITLMVFSADCVMSLFYDTKLQVIGAVHAGWRGTVQKITAKMLESMQQNFGTQAENVLVGIAPAIRACCYEVGEEVAESVVQAFGTEEKYLLKNPISQKYHFDLHYANQKQLIDVGILEKNITTMQICTQCESKTFFSSRAGKGITGRFAAGICLV